MNAHTTKGFGRFLSVALTGWLTLGMLLMGDWLTPVPSEARGYAAGPRGGAVAVGPRGAVGVGPNGGAAVRGPYGAAYRGPQGNVVAAPRGRVAPPPPPPPAYRYGYPRPVPVPVPVAPAYYGPSGSGVAAGMALGAMLTILPATAIAMQSSAGHTVYKVDTQCYKEVKKNGSTYYQSIACP